MFCKHLFLYNRDGLEDPLDDLGMVQQQLDQVSKNNCIHNQVKTINLLFLFQNLFKLCSLFYRV